MDREYKGGDVFLLFSVFPYTDSLAAPIPLGPNVYLDNLPEAILKDKAEADNVHMLLPGFLNEKPEPYLPKICLRYTGETTTKLTALEHLFIACQALRMNMPLKMVIAGAFDIDNQFKVNNRWDNFAMQSPWSTSGWLTNKDFEASARIVKRWLETDLYAGELLRSALTLFSQVTTGFSRSYQMNYLILFAALDALFIPDIKWKRGERQTQKGAFLANHASALLGSHLPEWLKHELEEMYRKGRNDLAHGRQDVTLGMEKLPSEKAKAIGRLHEITRLSLLGFLSLDEKTLRELKDSEANALTLKDKLETLKPPSDPLIDGQRMWCE